MQTLGHEDVRVGRVMVDFGVGLFAEVRLLAQNLGLASHVGQVLLRQTVFEDEVHVIYFGLVGIFFLHV